MKKSRLFSIIAIAVFSLLNLYTYTSNAQSTDTIVYDETLNKKAEIYSGKSDKFSSFELSNDGLAFTPIDVKKYEYNGVTSHIAYGYNQMAKVELVNGGISVVNLSEKFSNRLSFYRPDNKIDDDRLTFTGDYFYFATEGNTIVKLDWDLNIIAEITLPFEPFAPHYHRKLKYNSKDGCLYYLSYTSLNVIQYSELFIIDETSQQILHENLFYEILRDIEFNNNRNVYYLTIGNNLNIYECGSNTLLETIDVKAPAGPISYINKPGIHKIVVFPTGQPILSNQYAHIVNADNDQIITSIQLAHYDYSIAKTNVQNNICYATYGDINMSGDNEYGITGIDLKTNNLIFDNQWLNSYDDAVDLDIPNSSSYQAAVITRNCKLLTLDNNDNIDLQFENNKNLNNYETLISISDKFLLSNSRMNQIELIDENFDLADILHTAGTAFESKYNNSNGKVYFYADHKDSYLSFGNKSQGELMGNRIYVYDPDQQNWEKIILDDLIGGIAFNEIDHLIYAISRSSNELYVIDAFTNDLINTVEIPGNFGLELAWSSEQKLYTVAQWNSNAVSIHIFNTQNDGGVNPQYINHNIFFLATTGFRSYSHIDEETDDAYFSISSNKYQNTLGKIVKVNTQNNTFEQFTVELPSYFECLNDKVFTIKNATEYGTELNMLNINNNQQQTLYFDYPVNLIESAPNLNYILISECKIGSNNSKIYVVSADSLTINKEIEIPSRLSGMIYNPKNSTLYGLGPVNGANATACEIYAISVTTGEVGVYQTGFFAANRTGGGALGNMTLSFDENYDNVYIPTGYFNHGFELECDNEFLNVNDGWTWQSYPRLERQSNNPVDLTDFYDDNFYPQSGDLSVFNVENEYSERDYPNWPTVEFDEIQSTKGYKVYQSNNDSYVEMTGTIIDPETTITLETGENWLGYFLPEPHDAFDALKGVLEDIDAIRTQDWSCYKEYTSSKGGSEPVWVCAVKEGVGFTALEYGDMVEVNATAQATLKWNQNADVVKKKDIPEAQHFSYTELQDYQSIFVEVDTTQTDEIATYLNGECVGAAVVMDTLQEIRTYIPEGEQGEITFQTYSEGSKALNRISDYQVVFPEQKQQNTIKAENKERYYIVSLKGTLGTEEHPAIQDVLSVYPNPSQGKVNFDIYSQNKQKATLKLYNSRGILVDVIFNTTLPKGNSRFSVGNQAELPAGLYLYTFEAEHTLKNGKIIIE